MADQWMSTDDHSPTAGQWMSTDDHATPAAPSSLFERGKAAFTATIQAQKDAAAGLFGGIGAGMASTGVGAYNLARKLPGGDVLPPPNDFVNKLTQAPDNIAGFVGKGLEQAGEFALPMGAVADAVKGAPLAARIGAKMLTAGGTAAVQSGGDPAAIALTAGTEGVLGGTGAALGAGGRAVLNKVIDAGPRPLSQGAMAIAEKYGIPLSRGTQGGNRMTQTVEKVLGNTVSPGPYQELLEKGQAGIKNAAQDLTGGFATDQFAAGDATLRGLISHSSENEHTARASYDALAKFEADPANIYGIQTGTKQVPASGLLDASGKPMGGGTAPVIEQMGLPVDTTAQKAALQPIRDRIMRQLPFAQQQYSPGLKAIQNILDGPNAVPASVAEENLSALKAIQREAVDGKTKDLAGKAIAAANPAIESAVAEAGPDATKALFAGRAAWKEHAQTLDLIDSLAGDTSGKSGQTKVAQRLLRPADASFPDLQKVLAVAPDAAPALREAFLGKVFKKAETGDFTNPTEASNLWNQIGKRTKAALFEPEHIADVNSTLELAKRLAENPNPSGTGNVNALLKMGMFVAHPPSAIVAFTLGRKFAKVLYEPEGAAALRKLLSNPGTDSKAFAVVKALADKGAEAAGSQ
jgi:hypothetical protein